MRIMLKVPCDLLRRVHGDLARPHPFAAERVGFMTARAARFADGGILLLAFDYLVMPDDAYIPDSFVGARLHADGFRIARQRAYSEPVAVLHVHAHDHYGITAFSPTDLAETRRFMPDFPHVRPSMPHAAVILSRDSMIGRVWLSATSKPLPISAFSIVGSTIRRVMCA